MNVTFHFEGIYIFFLFLGLEPYLDFIYLDLKTPKFLNSRVIWLEIFFSTISKNKEEQNLSRYNEGQKIDAKISSIDLTNRKFALSIRQLEIDEEKSLLEKYGSKSSGSVLGDILGKALDEDKDSKEE